MATITGTPANDVLVGTDMDDLINAGDGNDTITGGAGNDTISGELGDDVANFNVTNDGADSVDLGTGTDVNNISAAGAGQVRLTFTSAEVGNGTPLDSNTMVNQNGGLAVRLQAENGSDGLTGAKSR